MLSLILQSLLQRWISNHLARINSVHINILLITEKLIGILSATLLETLGCRGLKSSLDRSFHIPFEPCQFISAEIWDRGG